MVELPLATWRSAAMPKHFAIIHILAEVTCIFGINFNFLPHFQATFGTKLRKFHEFLLYRNWIYIYFPRNSGPPDRKAGGLLWVDQGLLEKSLRQV